MQPSLADDAPCVIEHLEGSQEADEAFEADEHLEASHEAEEALLAPLAQQPPAEVIAALVVEQEDPEVIEAFFEEHLDASHEADDALLAPPAQQPLAEVIVALVVAHEEPDVIAALEVEEHLEASQPADAFCADALDASQLAAQAEFVPEEVMTALVAACSVADLVAALLAFLAEQEDEQPSPA